VRFTQFHEFAGQMLDRLSIGRVAVVPKLLSRPAAFAVADSLARIAVAPQPLAVIEMAGPECICLLEMSRRRISSRCATAAMLGLTPATRTVEADGGKNASLIPHRRGPRSGRR
jgi:hypothetical protein